VRGMPVAQARDLIMGPEGSIVTLGAVRDMQGQGGAARGLAGTQVSFEVLPLPLPHPPLPPLAGRPRRTALTQNAAPGRAAPLGRRACLAPAPKRLPVSHARLPAAVSEPWSLPRIPHPAPAAPAPPSRGCPDGVADPSGPVHMFAAQQRWPSQGPPGPLFSPAMARQGAPFASPAPGRPAMMQPPPQQPPQLQPAPQYLPQRSQPPPGAPLQDARWQQAPRAPYGGSQPPAPEGEGAGPDSASGESCGIGVFLERSPNGARPAPAALSAPCRAAPPVARAERCWPGARAGLLSIKAVNESSPAAEARDSRPPSLPRDSRPPCRRAAAAERRGY